MWLLNLTKFLLFSVVLDLVLDLIHELVLKLNAQITVFILNLLWFILFSLRRISHVVVGACWMIYLVVWKCKLWLIHRSQSKRVPKAWSKSFMVSIVSDFAEIIRDFWIWVLEVGLGGLVTKRCLEKPVHRYVIWRFSAAELTSRYNRGTRFDDFFRDLHLHREYESWALFWTLWRYWDASLIIFDNLLAND